MSDGSVSGKTENEWRGESARRWASQADRLDAQFEPLSALLFASAMLQAGERVLDVGCGRGATTSRAAQTVGETGWATGVDVGEPLINEARLLYGAQSNLNFVFADAQRHDFADASFDIAISRLGVMFFDDAAAAFANIRTAVCAGGRLVAAVWQARDRSEILTAPVQLGAAVIESHGYSVVLPRADGGPSSLGEPQRARDVLADAGWSGIDVALHDVMLYNGGPGPVERAVDVALTIGPLRTLLVGLPLEVERDVRAALTDDFAERHDGIGVKFHGAISILTAVSSPN